MSRHSDSLYVVATPIGNLQDITLRALDVLGKVDAVVSENVRKTRNLLDHYGLKTRVMSYREENAGRMSAVILGMLESGKSVALVAEAGTPGVSDPGRKLVDDVWKRGFKVVPVPGPSAALAAVSISGMDEQRFVFEGFLPRKRSKRRQRLAELADDSRLLVFFEAPHRMLESLADIKDSLGDRQCVVAREISKVHEDIERGSVSYFEAKFAAAKPLGEFVIICEGRGGVGAGVRTAARVSFDEAVKEAAGLLKRGLRKTEAAKLVAKSHGLASGDIYKALSRDAGPGAKGQGDGGKGELR
jgi:16S rRNA (cytidine1402-2'-O)-methyltransferase